MTLKTSDISYPYRPRLQPKVKVLLVVLTLAVVYLMYSHVFIPGIAANESKPYGGNPLRIAQNRINGFPQSNQGEILDLIAGKKAEPVVSNGIPSPEKNPRAVFNGIFSIDKGKNSLFYRIYPGNTVSQLSRAFGMPVEEFKGYTGDSRLYAYRWINIPLSKIEPYLVYRVKKGDTLIDIAGRFKTGRDSISVLNHIWTPSGLRTGSRILVLLDRVKR